MSSAISGVLMRFDATTGTLSTRLICAVAARNAAPTQYRL
jgi:hypothetical protein